MPFKLKNNQIKKIVSQLRKASKTHAGQADKLEKAISSPVKKVKGGGTRKVCLPAAKVRSMSASERSKVTSAKSRAAASGGYRRSSKSNVKGARKKGATLRDWFKKENWVQVGNPKKKCGDK